MRAMLSVLVVCAVLALTAHDARAQGMSMGTFKGYLTGHVGAISGGDLSSNRLSGGASVSVQENTGWGAELDFGHAQDAQSGRQVLDVTSYLVNAAFVRPKGTIRPFAELGAGVLQVNGCDAPCTIPAKTFDFAMNAGGGAFIALHDMFGLRADLRYIFSAGDHPELNRPDNFNYWRASFGVTYIWSIAP
jgi:uncharacterized membrane protein YeaQ/YmgE (transglycosylase-associated protein family)